MSMFKVSTAMAILLLAQGCSQGPELGKLDNESIRFLSAAKIDIYTLNQSALKDWAENKESFVAKLDAASNLTDQTKKLEALNDILDEMELEKIIDGYKPFDLEYAKSQYVSSFKKQVDDAKVRLDKANVELTAFMPTHTE